jgi:hypothetical protein
VIASNEILGRDQALGIVGSLVATATAGGGVILDHVSLNVRDLDREA